MSWTDEEIDNLFQESANELSFEYDNAYFREFEAASLPVNKKGRDFLWMGTALVFIGVLTSGYLFTNGTESASDNTTNQLASAVVSNGTITPEQEQEASKSTNTANETTTTSNGLDASAELIQMPNAQSTSGRTNRSFNGTRNAQTGNVTQVGSDPLVIAGGSTEMPESKQLLNHSEIPQHTESDKSSLIVGSEVSAALNPREVTQLENTINQGVAGMSILPLGTLTPRSAFYLEATGGLSQSLITPSSNFSNSYGGGFGIETRMGNFSLNTGLNFNVSNHQDLQLTRTWKIYSFGSTMGTDTYDYKNVYAVEMPISLGYNLGKHRFTVGVRPSVIVGAKIDHQTFEDESLMRSERIYGLAGGLQRFGFKPMIGYAFQVEQKWTIGVNVGVQLMRSVNEEFINGYNNPFPIDGQIYLRRSIRLSN